MLKRFYITMAFWVLAICALGLYAHSTPAGLVVVLVGILPIGFAFILLLLFYVPSKPLATDLPTLPDWPSDTAQPVVVDWEGLAETYPVEPHRQCNTIRLRPGKPALRLVYPNNTPDSFPE